VIDITLKLLPPQEAIEYFRQKGYQIGFSYLDVWQQEHQVAFTVAKAMELDLLADIRAQVDAALVNGTTLQTFIDELRPNLVKRGWWGMREVVDPKTGEKVLARLGSPRRLKVMYDTNLRTAHAECQWQRIQAVKDRLPYLMYDHTPSTWERPEHAAWDGLVLPADDPWWLRHMPVKAWACKCRVIQLGERQLKRLGKGVDQAPEELWRDYTNARSGETQRVPAGVDPAFNYPPGGRRQAIEKSLEEKHAREEAAVKTKPNIPSPPKFVEQPTAKAAAEWAVTNNLADYADYTGIKTEVANTWNKSLFDHLQEFPELRPAQKFTGTIQAQNARWRELEIQRFVDALASKNPDGDLAMFRRTAERWVKPRKTDNRYAQSWTHPHVSGISVNKKWGSADVEFKRHLSRDTESQWHPVGCDTVRSVVDHELGHQLDSLLQLSVDGEVKAIYKEAIDKGIASEVSTYAGKNIGEFIAECWAESWNSPSPREFARRIADIVRGRYRERASGV